MTSRFSLSQLLYGSLVGVVFVTGSGIAHAKCHSGWTLAGGLGWGVGEVKTNQQVYVPGQPNGTYTQTNMAPSGVIGNLAVGYDWEIAKCWILGFDIYGALSGMSDKLLTSGANPEQTTTFKMLNSFGLRMRPGGMIGKTTLFHLTLGVDWSRFKARASGGEFDSAGGIIQPGSLSSRRAGFVYGCGVLSRIVNWRKSSLHLGIEYLRTSYKQLPILTQPDSVNVGAGVVQTFKPYINAVMARLVWKF